MQFLIIKKECSEKTLPRQIELFFTILCFQKIEQKFRTLINIRFIFDVATTRYVKSV